MQCNEKCEKFTTMYYLDSDLNTKCVKICRELGKPCIFDENPDKIKRVYRIGGMHVKTVIEYE